MCVLAPWRAATCCGVRLNSVQSRRKAFQRHFFFLPLMSKFCPILIKLPVLTMTEARLQRLPLSVQRTALRPVGLKRFNFQRQICQILRPKLPAMPCEVVKTPPAVDDGERLSQCHPYASQGPETFFFFFFFGYPSECCTATR